jgi:membrane-associated phospholipid phosphatase
MSDVISKIARPAVVLAVSTATIVAFRRRPDTVRFTIAAPLALAFGKLLKKLYPEHRPRLFDRRPRQSFPSGHSAGAMAYLASLLDATRAWWATPIAGAAVVAVNRSRIRAREHWPRDVLAGDAVGLGAAVVAGAVARLISR